MSEQARVFISYSTQDAPLVERLKDDLKRAGVDVWIDHEQLQPGTRDGRLALLHGIKQTTTMIYAASPSAAESEYVDHEWAYAEDEGKTIIPFWIFGDKWSHCARFGSNSVQYIDGRGAAYTIGLGRLLAALDVTPSVSAVDVPQVGSQLLESALAPISSKTLAFLILVPNKDVYRSLKARVDNLADEARLKVNVIHVLSSQELAQQLKLRKGSPVAICCDIADGRNENETAEKIANYFQDLWLDSSDSWLSSRPLVLISESDLILKKLKATAIRHPRANSAVLSKLPITGANKWKHIRDAIQEALIYA